MSLRFSQERRAKRTGRLRERRRKRSRLFGCRPTANCLTCHAPRQDTQLTSITMRTVNYRQELRRGIRVNRVTRRLAKVGVARVGTKEQRARCRKSYITLHKNHCATHVEVSPVSFSQRDGSLFLPPPCARPSFLEYYVGSQTRLIFSSRRRRRSERSRSFS